MTVFISASQISFKVTSICRGEFEVNPVQQVYGAIYRIPCKSTS